MRAMDEFDCFMDAANRNGDWFLAWFESALSSRLCAVSIKQLIEAAKMQQHRQFLFLTPLSLTGTMKQLEGDPMVKITSFEKDCRRTRQ